MLRFVLSSMGMLLVLILPWYYLSPYLAAPVIGAAGEVMRLTFDWVHGVERHGTVGTLLTSLHVLVPQNGRFLSGELAPEVNYRTYGYGLALLWALLLASRPPNWWWKLVLGTAVLVPSQVVSMCFRWLREALLSSDPGVWQQTGLPHWFMEVIAYGYQFGFLMLTPLMPVLLWLALDRRFAKQVWLEASLSAAIESKP